MAEKDKRQTMKNGKMYDTNSLIGIVRLQGLKLISISLGRKVKKLTIVLMFLM